MFSRARVMLNQASNSIKTAWEYGMTVSAFVLSDGDETEFINTMCSDNLVSNDEFTMRPGKGGSTAYIHGIRVKFTKHMPSGRQLIVYSTGVR